MIVTIYDYNGKAKKVELKKEVKTMAIAILSGDELLAVEYNDGTLETYDSSKSRTLDVYDGGYFINEEILNNEEWLNSNNSYERQSLVCEEEE